MVTFAANALWYKLCQPAHRAFRRAIHHVADTQEQMLLRLLRRNAETKFGRRWDFATIRSAREYQWRVPLSTYDDYAQAIERIGMGAQRVLTAEPVILLEPTSGSTAATKYIPVTREFKAEVQRGVEPWIADLYRSDPSLLRGQAYWSLSPVTYRDMRTPAGILIGFEEDSEYFGWLQSNLVRSVLAVPRLVKLIDDMETFRYVTLLFLLRSRRLTLVSVWNPTFLTLMLARLAEWWPLLADDIAAGTISPPGPLVPDLHRKLTRLNRPASRRAAELRMAFRAHREPAAIHQHVWPQLRLVSCWTDGLASPYAQELAALFPHARLQGKGLLATEGVVSFPITGHPGAALAIRAHFFEFLPAEGASSSTGDIARLADELERGGIYEVVLTTAGGLYRYQLHDLVEVVGHLGQCPLLRFVGKAAHVSDHFGEKLNERHVQHALTATLARHALRPTFAMLACDTGTDPPAYTFFVETDAEGDAVLRTIRTELEAALCENFQYEYCRKLGQLGAIRVFRIHYCARETYLRVCQAHGQRSGDIKPTVLHRQTGWAQAFSGRYIT